MPAEKYPEAPSLQEMGFDGVTGNTPYRRATPAQVSAIEAEREAARSYPVNRTTSSSATVINVNFDGTHNNGAYPAPGEFPTNVFRLSQLQSQRGDAANTIYLPGPGAQLNPAGAVDANGMPLPYTRPSNWDALPMNAGRLLNASAEVAYERVAARVAEIRANDPNAEIAINGSAFSRGNVALIGLFNLLHERGIPGHIEPGAVKLESAILFDPVAQASGPWFDTLPPGVNNALAIVSLLDWRLIMPAMKLGPGVRVIGIEGSHTDIGGGTNPNGISAATLDIAVSIQNPEFAHFFFIHEHFERFTADAHRRTAPFYFFLPLVVAGFLPWMPQFFQSAWQTLKQYRFGQFSASWMLWAWFVIILLFFSVSRSKLPGYIMPVFPALAILAARNGCQVLLWGHNPDHIAALASDRENKQFEVSIGKDSSVGDLLRKLNINPVTVIVARSGELVLEEERLNEKDDLRILSVISGG